jgi:hypothetical protein
LQTAERAMNPALDKQLEAERRHIRQTNFLSKNKGKVHTQSRTNHSDRRRENNTEAAGPTRVAEGTRTKYAHVHSVFFDDALVKGKPPPSKVRAREEQRQPRNSWIPNALGADVRPATAGPRLSQTVAVPHRDSEPAWGSPADKQGRTMALPKYLVDRKVELQAKRPDDQQHTTVAVDPQPPEGFRWISEQTRKAEIRRWKVKASTLQAESDAVDKLNGNGAEMWKRRKEIELKLQRANTILRLLGVGRTRSAVLADKTITHDPE